MQFRSCVGGDGFPALTWEIKVACAFFLTCPYILGSIAQQEPLIERIITCSNVKCCIGFGGDLLMTLIAQFNLKS